jgi:hypothetical protein
MIRTEEIKPPVTNARSVGRRAPHLSAISGRCEGHACGSGIWVQFTELFHFDVQEGPGNGANVVLQVEIAGRLVPCYSLTWVPPLVRIHLEEDENSHASN